MDEAAKERKDYILDAWADVLVTTAFVVATLLVTALGHLVRHRSVAQGIALWSFEVGFTVAVVNHVLRMLWYRTVLGPICKKLFRWRPKGDRGGGKHHQSDHGPVAAGTDQLPLPEVTSTVALAEAPHFALLYPAPGGAGWRAAESLILGFMASLLTAIYLTLTRAGGEGLGAFITAVLFILGVLFYPRLAIYWAALAVFIAFWFREAHKKTRELEQRHKRR